MQLGANGREGVGTSVTAAATMGLMKLWLLFAKPKKRRQRRRLLRSARVMKAGWMNGVDLNWAVVVFPRPQWFFLISHSKAAFSSLIHLSSTVDQEGKFIRAEEGLNEGRVGIRWLGLNAVIGRDSETFDADVGS